MSAVVFCEINLDDFLGVFIGNKNKFKEYFLQTSNSPVCWDFCSKIANESFQFVRNIVVLILKCLTLKYTFSIEVKTIIKLRKTTRLEVRCIIWRCFSSKSSMNRPLRATERRKLSNEKEQSIKTLRWEFNDRWTLFYK